MDLARVLNLKPSDIPGVAGVAGLEVLLAKVAFPDWFSTTERGALVVLVALAVAIVLVRIGSLWDDLVFDGLYSDGKENAPRLARVEPDGAWQGRWCDRERNVWLVFPGGKALQSARRTATASLPPPLHESESRYKRAERQLKADNRWEALTGQLNLSKFFRALILPAAIGSIVAAVAGLVALDARLGWWCAAFAGAAVGSASGYAFYRVMFLRSVYEGVIEAGR